MSGTGEGFDGLIYCFERRFAGLEPNAALYRVSTSNVATSFMADTELGASANRRQSGGFIGQASESRDSISRRSSGSLTQTCATNLAASERRPFHGCVIAFLGLTQTIRHRRYGNCQDD